MDGASLCLYLKLQNVAVSKGQLSDRPGASYQAFGVGPVPSLTESGRCVFPMFPASVCPKLRICVHTMC